MRLMLFLVLLSLCPLCFTAPIHKWAPFPHSGGSSHHKCIHDTLEASRSEKGENPLVIPQNLPVNRITRAEAQRKRAVSQNQYPTFSPIRIRVDTSSLTSDPYTCYSRGQKVTAMHNDVNLITYTCTDADVLTQQKQDYLLNTLLATSVDLLEKALGVVSVSNLVLSGLSSCSSSSSFPVPVPSFYRSSGVNDADFVLFVTARPILGGSTLAFATTCAVDTTGRPIAGQANFNASNLIDDPNNLPRQSGVSTHEICHSLGFSSSRWSGGGFIEYTGTMSGPRYDYVTQPTSSIIATANDAGGNPYTTIVTPLVASTVRNHFGCQALLGGQIENGGGAGTTGSHWERRWFMNEFLTGSETNFPIFSNITLALFQDSGWYKVNFAASTPLLWGYNWGCEFLSNDCGKWTDNPKLPSEGFCKAPSTDVHCTFDRRGYGVCNIQPLSTPIPKHNQHYTDPSWGGQDQLADYCGYIGQIGATTFCNTGSTGSVSQVTDTISFISDYGEQFLLSSRCMFSTLNKVKTPIEIEAFQSVLAPVPRSARCYNHTCVSESDLRVQIDGVWYPCPSTADGNGKYLVSGVFGYGGELECPSPGTLCSGATADYSWPRLVSVSPSGGPPSTFITLTGSNFDINQKYEVILEVLCSNVTVVSSTTITAVLPPSEHFVSLANLYFFKTRLNLIVRDSRGYTDQQAKIFEIQVPLDAAYLNNLFNWMKANPLWALLVWAVILCPLVCIGCCIYKFLCKRPKKPKKGQHHADTHPDQYYDDDYAVDDYYDDYYAHGQRQGRHNNNSGYS